ncbi:hypothetical protein diail_7048 [Diaporthe ilicicola]|nr:hypothetical protein diail_7048 [Diaporthe ilicicola]
MALFFTLAESNAGAGIRRDATQGLAMRPSVLSRSTPTTQQEKAELMDLWSKSPLGERAQLEAWFETNRAEGMLPVSREFGQNRALREVDAVAPVTSPTEGQPNVANVASFSAEEQGNNRLGGPVSPPAGNGKLRHSNSPHLSTRPQRATRLSRHSPLSRGSLTSVASLPQTSRASRFANDNKKLYF